VNCCNTLLMLSLSFVCVVNFVNFVAVTRQ
jgi:hypothetical protein